MTDPSQQSPSFVRSLCAGLIEEELLLPFPTLTEEERETLASVIDSVDSLLLPLEDEFRKWDVAGELPEGFVDQLREFGLFGLVIPEDEGGLGFGSAAYSRTLQQIARHDASVAVTVGAHSSIGMRGLLLFGNEDQRSRYYPKLASGEMIAAFCLTEPGAGSDAAAIKTRAVREGDEWVINGSKIWVTNGGIADFYTVFAKTGPSDARSQLSAFLVTKDMPGVSVGTHEDKMGLRASSTTSVYLEDVRVPAANLLGEEGSGFKIAMNILNSGRSGLGGGSVGAMKRLLALCTKQANERTQFGRPIREFGMVKQKIGQMVVDCYAAESVVHLVAGWSDAGKVDYAVEAAISKVFSTEALWRSADEALQIAGGNGFMREYPYERIVRDCRINRIFEGTNDILRLFIALTAMNDVGASLRDLRDGLKGAFDHPIKGFGVLSDYALKRAQLATGLGGDKSRFTALHPRLGPEAEILESGTRQLATAVDRILRKHGKHIIGKQFASKRLSEILIDLFVLSAVCSRVDTVLRGEEDDQAERQLEIAQVFAAQVQRRVSENIARIDDNEDEFIKGLSEHACELEGYGWDVI